MKKTLIACGLLLVVSAAPAPAAGVNLNWTDCYAGGPVNNVSFACDQNTGASTLVGSYVSPAPIDSVCANEIVLDLQSDVPVLPLWWNLQTGGCRAGSLTRDFNFTSGPFSCADHWNGTVNFSAVGYTLGFHGPNTARVVMVGSVPSVNCSGPGGTGITSGVEYYSFKLTISHAKTTDAGSCAGCQEGVCIVLSEIKLVSPIRGTTPVQINLTYPDMQSYVTWQWGGPPGCFTPTLNQTWGAVKALYR